MEEYSRILESRRNELHDISRRVYEMGVDLEGRVSSLEHRIMTKSADLVRARKRNNVLDGEIGSLSNSRAGSAQLVSDARSEYINQRVYNLEILAGMVCILFFLLKVK